MKLIARDEQIRQLIANLKEALQGRLQVVFVTGEAGIGKTTLITNFIEGVQQKRPDLFVASSRCYSIAGSQQDAYLPFVQILKQLVDTNQSDKVWDRLRSGMAEVAPEWIEVIPIFGEVASATIRTAQWAQREFSSQGSGGSDTSRLMIQYTNALKLASETAPLLIWIDDLHWSDNATLDLVSFLADHASDSRIMLIASYRPTDVAHDVQGQPHPVRKLVRRLERYNECEQIPLSSFTRADLEHFLTSGSHNFPTEFVDRLWRQSGGNPLFVQEYVSLLHERSLVREEQGAFVLVQQEIEIDIPDSVQAVIEERLDLIGKDLHRLLSYASVQGERFVGTVLAQLLRSDEIDVLERLNLLERVHKLIRELEASHLIIKVGGEYQFIHALIQQTLYNNLSVGQRRHLHGAIAQLLESLYGENASLYAADLAIHFERGGDMTKAIPYYLQAGRAALAIFALDDALLYAEKVRELAAQIPDKEQATAWQLDALIQIAETHHRKAEYDASLAACEEGEALCQNNEFAEQHAYVLYWRSTILNSLGRYLEALRPNQQALDLLGDSPTDRRLQGYLYTSSHSDFLEQNFPTNQRYQRLTIAMNIAQKYNLSDVKLRVISRRAWLAMQQEVKQPKEALRHAQEALQLAKNQNNIVQQISSYRAMAWAFRYLKQDRKELECLQYAMMVARQYGLPRELHMTLFSMSNYWHTTAEDWQKSLHLARESMGVSETYNFPPYAVLLRRWFSTALGLGLWDEAEQVLEHYRALYQRRNQKHLDTIRHCRMHGQLSYVRGCSQQAYTFLKTAIEHFEEHGAEGDDEGPVREAQVNLGLVMIQQNMLSQSLDYLDQSAQYWKEQKRPVALAQCLRGTAQIDMLSGNYQQAITRLRKGLSESEGVPADPLIGWPVWQHVCVDLGRALLATGETEEALQHAMFGYQKFKKWGHFLLGEAAFVVGQILVAQGKREEALTYLHEARRDWQRLELTHHLPAWEAFMQEHGLETASS